MTLAVLVAAIARPATRAARVAWTSCLVAGMLACGASTVACGAGPLEAAHWIARCAEPDRVVADANAVAAFNRRLLAEDPALTDLAKLPATIPQAEVEERVRRRSAVPDRPLVFGDGTPADEAARRRWREAIDDASIPATVEPRFALIVRRAAVRRLPTRERVHASAADTDIDQFQETAFFPGTPVAVVHATADNRWAFVIGTTYDGWVESDALAFGSRADVLGYAERASRVITAARATTAFTPELPAASAVDLDMGTTLPERRDWPSTTAVNGQSAAAAVVVELPLRDATGVLRIAPALLPLSAGSHDGPLPATRANLLRQAFSFLGERYGWGHDFDGRDCSGFVSDVYKSLGFLLPRNTRDQQISPCLDRTPLPAEWSRDRRMSAVAALRPGDLAYSRRHVMMVVGHDEAGPWVIHDTHEGRPASGAAAANGVVVQPLGTIDPSLASLTTLVRILPSSPTEPP